MTINPILPIWLMGILCIILLFFKRKGIANYIRQILVIVLLFAINLRIMVPNGDMPTVQTNVDVLFVVDNTISMLAEDYDQNGTRRMDAVKEDCAYIMEQLPGASFSVVSFDNAITTLLPYTPDQNNALQAIHSLNGQASLHASGSAFNDVLEFLQNSLNKEKDPLQIVFFISDGEITRDEKLDSFPEIGDHVDGGAVLGYGTEDGGFMKAAYFTGDDSDPSELYYYDEDLNYERAVSKLDEGNLESIAADMNVEYIHMTKQSALDQTLTQIKEQAKDYANEEHTGSTKGYSDTFFYLLPLLLLLLIIDFIYYKRKTQY